MGRGKSSDIDTALRTVVGNNIKIARERAGYSQRDLCSMTGISQSYLSQLEKGQWNVGIDNIAKISRAIGIAAHDLLNPRLGKALRELDTTSPPKP